ncbi:glycosyltransferase family 4 protein [Flavobacterium sp. SE-s27]|uniref:Glycosyltransferase family 4 protein n=2 Tax=Flavobacterium solisilvae TaxID=1852019 RepID=A0ABX1QWZ3_9FLAO|nr:glycosyltransferase family 4 protein [Flavobacterium solisilvae]
MSENGFEVIGVSSSGQELQDVEQEENIRTISVEMTRTISLVKDLITLWNFYNLCKREKPLIVHSHTPKAGIIGMLGAKLAKVPIRLHTVAGLPLMEAKGIKRVILDFVEKKTYSYATKVYPNSKGLFDFIIENRYTSEEKLKIIGNGSSNGINTNYFSLSKITDEQKKQLRIDLNIAEIDFVFVFVGRLVRDKGINELVSAFSILQTLNNKLLLVGSQESDLDPLLPNTLEEIKSNANIISVGFQNDVRPYLAISNCLVFPSYREGFPNVVMQAGAMELPSIVSDINGCNEIIVQNENGIIIPVKDEDSLKLAMIKLKEDEVLYEKLKQNSRSMIVSRYEQSVVWNALLNEYNTLLKEKGYNV